MAVTYLFSPNTIIKSAYMNQNFEDVTDSTAFANNAIDSGKFDFPVDYVGLGESEIHSNKSNVWANLSYCTVTVTGPSAILVTAQGYYSVAFPWPDYVYLQISTPSGCTLRSNAGTQTSVAATSAAATGYSIGFSHTALFTVSEAGTYVFNIQYKGSAASGDVHVKYDTIYGVAFGTV